MAKTYCEIYTHTTKKKKRERDRHEIKTTFRGLKKPSPWSTHNGCTLRDNKLLQSTHTSVWLIVRWWGCISVVSSISYYVFSLFSLRLQMGRFFLVKRRRQGGGRGRNYLNVTDICVIMTIIMSPLLYTYTRCCCLLFSPFLCEMSVACRAGLQGPHDRGPTNPQVHWPHRKISRCVILV